VTSDDASAHELACFNTLQQAIQMFLAGDFVVGSAATEELAHASSRARLVMWLGAVFLNVFVSANWTGPPLKELALSPLPWHAHLKACVRCDATLSHV